MDGWLHVNPDGTITYVDEDGARVLPALQTPTPTEVQHFYDSFTELGQRVETATYTGWWDEDGD